MSCAFYKCPEIYTYLYSVIDSQPWSSAREMRQIERIWLRPSLCEMYDVAWSPDSTHIIACSIDQKVSHSFINYVFVLCSIYIMHLIDSICIHPQSQTRIYTLKIFHFSTLGRNNPYTHPGLGHPIRSQLIRTRRGMGSFEQNGRHSECG